MLKFAVAVFSLALVIQAHAASGTCSSLQRLASQHRAWKSDFHKFQRDGELTPDQKFDLSRSSMDVVVKRLRDVQSLAGTENNNHSLLQETTRFLNDVDTDMLTHRSAQNVMDHALPNYEDVIDDALLKAQSQNPDCDLSGLKKYLPSSSMSSAQTVLGTVRGPSIWDMSFQHRGPYRDHSSGSAQ